MDGRPVSQADVPADELLVTSQAPRRMHPTASDGAFDQLMVEIAAAERDARPAL